MAVENTKTGRPKSSFPPALRRHEGYRRHAPPSPRISQGQRKIPDSLPNSRGFPMVPVWLQTVVRSLLEFQRSSYSLPASIEFRKISVGILTTFWYPIAAKIAGVASG